MKRIAVIVNPFAKKIRRGNISIDKVLKYESEYIKIIITKSSEEIEDAIRVIKDGFFDYIGIIGGDGSLHNVLSGIINIYEKDIIPPILIIKGGTMNNVSRSIDLRGDGSSIIQRLDEALRQNRELEICERDSLKIGDKYGFLFGTGFVTNFLNAAYSGSEKGFKQNLTIMLKAVFQGLAGKTKGSLYEGITADVYTDGVKIPYNNILAILAGTVEHIGMGFSPLSKGNKKTGCFHAIIPGYHPSVFIKNIFSIKKGKKINHTDNFDDIINIIKIKSDKTFQYTIDGDLYESAGSLEVSIGPSIKFIKI